MDEHAIRRSERSIIREWIYGLQIDILWQGRDPHYQAPRPLGPIRAARNRGLEDALSLIQKRDDEAPDAETW